MGVAVLREPDVIAASTESSTLLSMRVLIVEDSSLLRRSLTQGLSEAGYAVDAVPDGRTGFIYAQTSDYDVVVLDWMLPEMDGIAMLRAMRDKGIASHVLMLTARDAIDERVAGLGAGADDYLVKPFAFAELLARVRALSRRAHGTKTAEITIGPLVIDTGGRMARVGARGEPLALTPREYAILEYLAHRRGKPANRMELEEHIYDGASQVMSNAVESAICALRAKLAAAGCPPLLHTRRRVGYVLSEDAPP